MFPMQKDIREMKHFRKWAEGKSLFLVTLALSIAGFSKEYFEMSESIKKEKRIEGDIPLPSLKRWLKMYYNRETVFKVLLNALGSVNDNTAKGANMFKSLFKGAKQLKNMTIEQLKAECEKILPDERKKIIEDSYRTIEDYKEYIINDFAMDFYVFQCSHASGAGGRYFNELCGLNVLYSSRHSSINTWASFKV